MPSTIDHALEPAGDHAARGYQSLRSAMLRIESLAAQVQMLALQASVESAGARGDPSSLHTLPQRMLDAMTQISQASAQQADAITSLDDFFGRGPEDALRLGGRWRRAEGTV